MLIIGATWLWKEVTKEQKQSKSCSSYDISTVIDNATMMLQTTEGLDKYEAQYLSFCGLQQACAIDPHKDVLLPEIPKLMSSKYPELMDDFKNYLAWVYGLNPSFSNQDLAKMQKRHELLPHLLNYFTGVLSVENDKRGTFINYADQLLKNTPKCYRVLGPRIEQLVDILFKYTDKQKQCGAMFEVADEHEILHRVLIMCIKFVASKEIYLLSASAYPVEFPMANASLEKYFPELEAIAKKFVDEIGINSPF